MREKGYDCSICDSKQLQHISEEMESYRIEENFQRYLDGEVKMFRPACKYCTDLKKDGDCKSNYHCPDEELL